MFRESKMATWQCPLRQKVDGFAQLPARTTIQSVAPLGFGRILQSWTGEADLPINFGNSVCVELLSTRQIPMIPDIASKDLMPKSYYCTSCIRGLSRRVSRYGTQPASFLLATCHEGRRQVRLTCQDP